jgi:molecular chaperone DnaK (HSP70)
MTLGKQYGEALLETMTKELVITVPAVWSERAKDLTLKAVTGAKWGTDKIALVTEPEAAAIYTLKWMTEGANREEVKVGDQFVL